MSWTHFDHDADIGIEGRGATPEAAFEEAARAMFAIQADPAQVRAVQSLEFDFEEPDLDFALVAWLNGLLAHARTRGLVLGSFSLRRSGDRWHALARGEPWPEGLERGVEVKGATLTGLDVRAQDGAWVARLVVDV